MFALFEIKFYTIKYIDKVFETNHTQVSVEFSSEPIIMVLLYNLSVKHVYVSAPIKIIKKVIDKRVVLKVKGIALQKLLT